MSNHPVPSQPASNQPVPAQPTAMPILANLSWTGKLLAIAEAFMNSQLRNEVIRQQYVTIEQKLTKLEGDIDACRERLGRLEGQWSCLPDKIDAAIAKAKLK